MRLPEHLLRIISYFFVIPKRKTPSAVNGLLEVNYANGKKVLDAANTNYSFGSLQQVLRYGLTKIDFSGISTVLVLGVGGGSVIRTLRDEFEFSGTVTGVEIDPVVLQLAREEFGLKTDQNMKLINVDAGEFLRNSTEIFDLVIIDIFIDLEIPDFVFERSFVEDVVAHLTDKGQLLVNCGFERQRALAEQFIQHLQVQMDIKMMDKIGGVNTLLVGQKKHPLG